MTQPGQQNSRGRETGALLEIGGDRLKTIFDAIPAIICVLTGPDHVFEYVNDGYRQVVGQGRDLLGRPVREALPEIVDQGFLELLDEVYRSGDPFYGTEVPVQLDRLGDGTLDQAYVNFVYLPTRDAEGRVDGVLAHGVEVTDSVHARLRVEMLARDVELQRASLETIIERMPAGVVLCDASGAITAANSVWREFFGVPLGELPDIGAWSIFEGRRTDGTPLQPHEYPLARSILHGETILGDALVFFRADGEERTIEVNSAPIRAESGEIVSGVAVFTDVTERLRLQAEIASRTAMEQAQTRLQAVFEAAGDGVWVLNEDGITIFVNPAACKMTGFSAEELIGKRSHPLIHHSRSDGSAYPMEECPIYRSVFHAEPCRVDDEVFWRKDGSSFAAEYSSTPMFDGNGNCRGAVQVFRDVTEQRRAEERKAEFFANASHELRTPLTAISGFATTLADRWDQLPDGQRLGFVNIIAEQSERMARLINSVLTLSRLERGKLVVEPEPIELRGPLEAVATAFPHERLEVHCGPGITASCDPDHLQQMLFNYVDNALKYGAPPIEIAARSDEDCVMIEVADGGAGVPEQFRDRLFERFSQAERRPEGSGTGLGLSIVKNLAEAQGGDAWFEPREPQGSRFLIRLPRAQS